MEIKTKHQLENALTANLKDYIKLRHYESGSLYESARVKVEGELEFVLIANDYIKYLDNGEFVSNFFGLPSTIKLIEEYINNKYTIDIEIEKGSE